MSLTSSCSIFHKCSIALIVTSAFFFFLLFCKPIIQTISGQIQRMKLINKNIRGSNKFIYLFIRGVSLNRVLLVRGIIIVNLQHTSQSENLCSSFGNHISLVQLQELSPQTSNSKNNITIIKNKTSSPHQPPDSTQGDWIYIQVQTCLLELVRTP